MIVIAIPKHLKVRVSSKEGFTLLEVCVALAVATLVLGVAVLGLGGVAGEQALKQASHLVEAFVQDARSTAIREGRECVMVLTNEGIRTEGPAPLEVSFARFGLTLDLRRSGEVEFRSPKKGETWSVRPRGVCEPLELRLRGERGYTEILFEPLTGFVARRKLTINP